MRSPSWPQSARPFFHVSAVLAASSSGVDALRVWLRRRRSRGEILGRELRKREQQIAEIALGIDDDRGDAVDGRFFEQRQAEARLAAAGHADADGVRGQVLRVVEQQFIGRLAAARS